MTGYPALLNQAFMTLLDNAREAIEREGTITLRSRMEGSDAVLEVADTGRGMAPERVATLFEFDFTRKESQVRFRMGLAYARQVVEEHGGNIVVESEPGRGTTFRVRLPTS